MSQTSEFFKVPKRPSKCIAFATKKVEKWMERLGTEDFCINWASTLPSIEENDVDVDELDWDDVGSAISSYRNTTNGERVSSSNIVTKKRKSARVSSRQEPIHPLFKPKRFKPVILTHISGMPSSAPSLNQSWSETDPTQNCVDLNSSRDRIYREYTLAHVDTSFQAIQNYLDDISCYSRAPSICGSQMLNKTLEQSTQTENDCIDSAFDETEEQSLPMRSFDENSIDPLLAFRDMNTFIKLIYEQNQLFENETDVDEVINSQVIASQENLSVEVVANRNYGVVSGLPPQEQALQKGLNEILSREDFGSATTYERPSAEITNESVKSCIRAIFAQYNEAIKQKRKVQIKVPRLQWDNTCFENGMLVLFTGEKTKFAQLRGRCNIVLYLLRKVYGLLMLRTQLTQRSIYYQLKSLLADSRLSQTQVSSGINIVCNLLQRPYWELNLQSTSKGLIYGELMLTIGSTLVKCNAQNGTIIPNDLNDLRKVETTAYFILIVEKDTVFQKLLADNLLNKLSRSFILITGKGYPDIGTRRLLNILWRLLGIPMFIIVDADAYGIDIFLTYKFGSLAHCHMAKALALPKLKWLGVLPSDMKDYVAKTLPLKDKDSKKLKSMLNRPYFQNGNNKAIREEINCLIRNKKICEIESIFQSNLFFTEYYLPMKLVKMSFL